MNAGRILFVRSGGGMPGLDIHAGIWLALEKAGIRATDCWGTSAGAIVGALDAAGQTAANAADFLRGLTDADVRDARVAWKLRIPWIDYYLRPEPILRLLQSQLPAAWGDLYKPLRVFATDATEGAAVDVRDAFSNPARAVLASMSICGAFPPAPGDDGHTYFDGGVGANLPAPGLDATEVERFAEIWLLVASGRPRTYTRNDRMLTRLVQSAHWLMHNQLRDSIEECRTAAAAGGRTRVRVVWPELPTPRGALHFDHDLIAQAEEWTRKQLEREAKA